MKSIPKIELINQVANAAVARGHYSQAAVHGDTIYVSGQLGINPITQDVTVGTIEEQVENILTSISSILKAANSNLSMVVKATIYLSDIKHWDRVNEVYNRFFGIHKPARIVIPVNGKFHLGFEVAVDVIAIKHMG